MENVAKNVTHTPSFDSARSINDFADMLENIFHGHPGIPTRPLQLTEPNWSLQELKGAIQRMKANKASDDCGLVAELLHFAPENVVTALLGIMNQILHTGQVPSSWQKSMSQMLPKTKNARTTKDFRPIANIRLMYKTFAYLILGRIEEPLEHALKNSMVSERNAGSRSIC